MSVATRTGVIRSTWSVNQRFHCAMLRIVSVNASQIEQVQFAAVNPPLRMSAKTARLHLEMTRPSITVSESCIPVMQFPEKPRERTAGLLSTQTDRKPTANRPLKHNSKVISVEG